MGRKINPVAAASAIFAVLGSWAGAAGRGGAAAIGGAAALFGAAATGGAAVAGGLDFQKQVVTTEYHSEGADMGDFNRDGIPDLVSGPYWYEGPDLQVRHEYQSATVYNPSTDYTSTFMVWVSDFNGDLWPDILSTGIPGSPGYWFQNPGPGAKVDAKWTRREAIPVLGNESPGLFDLNGDGKPEMVFNTNDGFAGWSAPAPGNLDAPWTFHPITTKGSWNRFTHGLGMGDINKDGRLDLLENEGWWEQPVSLADDPVWKKHTWVIGGAKGGAQIYAYDVDADGDNDVVSSLDAHGWGLAWFEQVKVGEEIGFTRHPIMGDRSEESRYGVAFSQVHALALADMDEDGIKDLVTGKRKWAHGPTGDVEPNGATILCVFKLQRSGGKVTYLPKVLDTAFGVGTQVEIRDLSGDGMPDILVGNKNGTSVFRKLGGSSLARNGFSRWRLAYPLGLYRWVDALGVVSPWGKVEYGGWARGRILFPGINSPISSKELAGTKIIK